MKNIITCLLTVCLTLPLLADTPNAARKIMEQYRKATAVKDLTSQLTYTNISKSGRKQTRTLKQYIACNNEEHHTYNLFLAFTAPHDVAGTATLTIQQHQKEDEQWLYLPAIGNSKRISASKKADRFMGTEMTYEDLSSYLAEPLDAYQYSLLGEEAVAGRKAFKLVATPLANTLTQYSKRILWIDQQTHLIVKTEFFDKNSHLLKVYTATDIRPIGESNFFKAHQIAVENVQTSNTTQVRYEGFVINHGLSADIFTKTWLETRL
jgi:outer membrane lipoprotein-sorting protein